MIDLRDAPECDPEHSLDRTAEFIHAPVAGGLDRNLDDLDAFNVTLLSGDRAKWLTATVAMIAASEALALVHCTGGKDRTGAVVALVLALLGVERDVIIEDHALTEGNVEALKERIRVAGATNDYLAGIAPVGDAWRAQPQTITALLDPQHPGR